jgi:hypothetical protein
VIECKRGDLLVFDNINMKHSVDILFPNENHQNGEIMRQVILQGEVLISGYWVEKFGRELYFISPISRSTVQSYELCESR